MKYEFDRIEKKWQKKWEETGAFRASDDYSKPKFYALVEFPYPSGQGLHVGHPRSYTALDIVVRKKRMQGYNVLYPMGWDAFGLPAENFAIKNHVHPEHFTRENIRHFKEQMISLGLSFDWSREVATIDPDYYNGPSGSSCSSSSAAWPTRPPCPSTGVPAANAFWPTKRWSTAFASAAARR